MLLAIVVAVGGCRFGKPSGPVPDELLKSRRLTQRGIVALERRDWPTAEQLLSQAIATCPTECESRRHYAEALWQRGAREEAIEQLEEAIRLSGNDPNLLLRAGEMHLEGGQIELATQIAQAVLDLDPTSARAWVLRGRAMQQAGQAKQALADFHRALAREPGNRDVLLRVAELQRSLDRPNRALLALQAVLDTYPALEEPAEVLYLVGLAYSAMGRPNEALDQYHLALERGGASPELLYRAAEAELLAGRAEAARSMVEQALALDPRHAGSRALVARLSSVASSALPVNR